MGRVVRTASRLVFAGFAMACLMAPGGGFDVGRAGPGGCACSRNPKPHVHLVYLVDVDILDVRSATLDAKKEKEQMEAVVVVGPNGQTRTKPVHLWPDQVAWIVQNRKATFVIAGGEKKELPVAVVE